MNQPAIEVNDLRKTYTVPVRDPGLAAAMKSLVHRRTKDVHAVQDISFEIGQGEVVGFLGPNGAGKTTTLKMLAGLLHPTSGSLQVLGFEPQRRDRAYLRQMALVMGNRNQLQWDIPAADSFDLNQAIYQIPMNQYRRTRDDLVQMLDAGDLINKPVRGLSLGERMKVEIIGSLLHLPRVLFLDEPTIGLDLTMQKRIRTFVADYNRTGDATVILTSHYMADVEALAKRVVLIHHGEILFDGQLAELTRRFSTHKTLQITLESAADLGRFGEVVSVEGLRTTLKVPKDDSASVMGQLLSSHLVLDLTITDPAIEDVIEGAFADPVEAVDFAADGNGES